MSIIYNEWGFRQNPFQHTPLPASEEGAKLLIGREKELKKVITRIASPPSVVTVEGRNGIGKTSLVNVAAFTAFSHFLGGKPIGLYIPCVDRFQLEPSQTTDAFLERVYLALAQTLVTRADELKGMGRATAQDAHKLDKWLNSPILTSIQGGLSAISGGKGEATNDTPGFSLSGLRRLVEAMLVEMFADGEAGGVVCVIDNLELLRSSDRAREQLEALRDQIFDKRGLRWVLCGSTGIVRGLAGTSRLSGVLYEPIEITDIEDTFADAIFQSRVDCFCLEPGKYYLPLHETEFRVLFDVLNSNIRDTLNYANNYCMHAFESAALPSSANEKRDLFSDWLQDQAAKVQTATSKTVTPKAWELFDKILKDGGECSPGDNKAYGFKSPQAMRSHLIKLENCGLIQSVRNDDDSRRKTIAVTPKGWLVNCARRNMFGTLFSKVPTSHETDSR